MSPLRSGLPLGKPVSPWGIALTLAAHAPAGADGQSTSGPRYWSRGAVARDERLGGAVAHPTLLHRAVVDGLDDDRVRPHVRLVGILERRLARVRERFEIPRGIGEDLRMRIRRLCVEANPEFHGPTLSRTKCPNGS